MAPRKTAAASTAKTATAAKPSTKNSTTKAAKTAAIPSRSRKTAEPEPADDASEELNGADESGEEELEETKPAPKKKSAAPKKAATTKETATKKTPAPKKATAKSKKNDTTEVNGDVKKPAAKVTKSKAPKEKETETKENGEDEQPQETSTKTSSKSKRKERDDDGDHEPSARVKKVRTVPVPTVGATINVGPDATLDVFVFGEGTSGELGLGSRKYDGKKPIDVKRPRINHNLSADTVGVVQIACGGMHVVALTRDDKILTWGVNDDRALGRDTTWEGGVRDVDDEDSDSDDDDDTGLNPNESTPGEVDFTNIKLPGTKFVQIVATDSASFVLTADGRVYGWGTFRGTDGIIGFADEVRIQQVPIQIEGLKSITRLAAGANHVLALDVDGKVFTWGSGGQYQLGRKAITRGKNSGLKPEPCGKFTRKNHAVDIAAGSYHSFYTDNHGQVWAWGLNNYSQTGHTDDTGKDDAMVLVPKPVKSLNGRSVISVDGGEHHSVAATASGELLTWGRVDGHQVGHPTEIYNEDNTVFDDNGKPRILVEPTAVPGTYIITIPQQSKFGAILTALSDVKATFVAAGTDNSFALTKDGKVYSWGFSANYQTGQGTTDDIEVPTVIDNTAIRGRKITWAGAGGQYSMLAASRDAVLNGVNGESSS